MIRPLTAEEREEPIPFLEVERTSGERATATTAPNKVSDQWGLIKLYLRSLSVLEYNINKVMMFIFSWQPCSRV